jgi:hypothetical protein
MDIEWNRKILESINSYKGGPDQPEITCIIQRLSVYVSLDRFRLEFVVKQALQKRHRSAIELARQLHLI